MGESVLFGGNGRERSKDVGESVLCGARRREGNEWVMGYCVGWGGRERGESVRKDVWSAMWAGGCENRGESVGEAVLCGARCKG